MKSRTMGKLDKAYIKRLEKYVESTQKAIDYSVERFDILIISLSTSGLILSIGFVKNVITDFSKIDSTLLKISWLLFAVALILNLLSQVTGYYANKFDLEVTKDVIRVEKGKASQISNKGYECWHVFFNNCTHILNGGSLIGLISGIIVLIVFVLKFV